jgi:uncharacterized protein (TIRG00374 family)
MKKWKSKLIIALLLAVVVYAAMTILGQADQVAAALFSFDLTYVPLVLSLTLFNFALRFLRWQYYLKIMGWKLSLKNSILIYTSSFALTITPGKVGDFLKSYYLKKFKEISFTESASLILIERVTDMFGTLILSLFGCIVFGVGKDFVMLIALALSGLVILFSFPKIGLPLIKKVERIPKIGKYAVGFEKAYQVSGKLLRLDRLFFASMLSTLAWFAECAGLYYVFQGLGGNISLFQATFIYAFSSSVGAATMLPGGLGGAEATMSGLLLLLGVKSSLTVAGTILIRTMTLWFAVAVGAVFWLMLTRSKLVKLDKLAQFKAET